MDFAALVASFAETSASGARAPPAAIGTESLDTDILETATGERITNDVEGPQRGRPHFRVESPTTLTGGFPLPPSAGRVKRISMKKKDQISNDYNPTEHNWINVAEPTRIGLLNMHERQNVVEEKLLLVSNQFHRFRVNVRDSHSRRLENEYKTQKLLMGICSFKPLRKALRRHLFELPEDENEAELYMAGTPSEREIYNSNLDRSQSPLSTPQHTTQPSKIQDATRYAATAPRVPSRSPSPARRTRVTACKQEGSPPPTSPLATQTRCPSSRKRMSVKSLVNFGGLKQQPRLSITDVDKTPEDSCSSSDDEDGEQTRVRCLEQKVLDLEESSRQMGRDLFVLKEQVQKNCTSTAERFVQLDFQTDENQIRQLGAEGAEERLPELLMTFGALEEPTTQRAGQLFLRAANAALTTELQEVHRELQAEMVKLRCELDNRIDQLNFEDENCATDSKNSGSEAASNGCNGASDSELDHLSPLTLTDHEQPPPITTDHHLPSPTTSKDPGSPKGTEVDEGDATAIVVQRESTRKPSTVSSVATAAMTAYKQARTNRREQRKGSLSGFTLPAQHSHSSSHEPASIGPEAEARMLALMEPAFQRVADVESRFSMLADFLTREEESRKQSIKLKANAWSQEAETLRCLVQELKATWDAHLERVYEKKMAATVDAHFENFCTIMGGEFNKHQAKFQELDVQFEQHAADLATLKQECKKQASTPDIGDHQPSPATADHHRPHYHHHPLPTTNHPPPPAMWGEHLMAKMNDHLTQFVDRYREERRTYSRNLSVLFPRAFAQAEDARRFSVSEARLFAQDVRLDAMEEQLGRWSAERAEMQARISALNNSITASPPSEGSAGRCGSRSTSARKAVTANPQVAIETSSATVQQCEERGLPQVVDEGCMLGLQAVPRSRTRPRTARERQGSPTATGLMPPSLSTDVNGQSLQKCSHPFSCNKKIEPYAPHKTPMLLPSLQQNEAESEDMFPMESTLLRRGKDLSEDRPPDVPTSCGQVSMPESLPGDRPLPAKARRPSTSMQLHKAKVSAVSAGRPQSANLHCFGP